MPSFHFDDPISTFRNHGYGLKPPNPHYLIPKQASRDFNAFLSMVSRPTLTEGGLMDQNDFPGSIFPFFRFDFLLKPFELLGIS
jgi:hypothetical protein